MMVCLRSRCLLSGESSTCRKQDAGEGCRGEMGDVFRERGTRCRITHLGVDNVHGGYVLFTNAWRVRAVPKMHIKRMGAGEAWGTAGTNTGG